MAVFIREAPGEALTKAEKNTLSECICTVAACGC